MQPIPALHDSIITSASLLKSSSKEWQSSKVRINLLKPTCYVMHQQFDIQQLHTLPTLYLCVLYLSENKQLLVPLTA